MPAPIIAQLLIAYGPAAIQLIQTLAAVWTKPALTIDEVNTICAVASTSADAYLANARAALGVSLPTK